MDQFFLFFVTNLNSVHAAFSTKSWRDNYRRGKNESRNYFLRRGQNFPLRKKNKMIPQWEPWRVNTKQKKKNSHIFLWSREVDPETMKLGMFDNSDSLYLRSSSPSRRGQQSMTGNSLSTTAASFDLLRSRSRSNYENDLSSTSRMSTLPTVKSLPLPKLGLRPPWFQKGMVSTTKLV